MYFISPPFGNYLNLDKCISIKGSFTLEPRDGLFKQIIKTLYFDTSYWGWVNKIGLRNKGIEYGLLQKHNSIQAQLFNFIDSYMNYLLLPNGALYLNKMGMGMGMGMEGDGGVGDGSVGDGGMIDDGNITSIAILNYDEINKFLEIIPENKNIEINISCPNVNKQLVDKDIQKFLNPKREWCILKLSPLIEEKKIDYYYDLGFRQFHCSNTIPIEQGGLSGKNIMKYNEKIIPYIKKYKDTEVIAGGGITKYKDILYYKNLGADHFSFSSVCFCPYLLFFLYNSL